MTMQPTNTKQGGKRDMKKVADKEMQIGNHRMRGGQENEWGSSTIEHLGNGLIWASTNDILHESTHKFHIAGSLMCRYIKDIVRL